MEQPQEVRDEEHERVWERVAAVDVAKASGVVCTRVPDEGRPGRRTMHVRTVKATKRAIIGLGDYPRCQQIQVITLESTSDHWRIWRVAPEAAGLMAQLVNARHVRNVPGRAETGKKDAVWLAKLTERGLLQPGFVPPPEIRRLRECTRLRADLVHERTRYRARLEKLLERALTKISSVASAPDTDSCRAMIGALIRGERNPRVIADLAIGKMRPKRKALAAIARSILVIIFHLLAGRTARFGDLGPDWYDHHIDAQRKTRNLIRQLEALGRTVTLTPAKAAAARPAHPESRRHKPPPAAAACPLNPLIPGQPYVPGWGRRAGA